MNKPRVFFVGIHNKPGLPPLCSTTKSGKVIDKVIAALPGVECIKTNLFNTNFETPLVDPPRIWAKRVGATEHDVIILLGGVVTAYFRRSHIAWIRQGWNSFSHPSRADDAYVDRMVTYIRSCL
jgi:hypothetical protein